MFVYRFLSIIGVGPIVYFPFYSGSIFIHYIATEEVNEFKQLSVISWREGCYNMYIEDMTQMISPQGRKHRNTSRKPLELWTSVITSATRAGSTVTAM
ncbi:hypothetical protein CAEBREN_22136 [Caenorhabditis brenneri]|uniref:Uncharacterized protein n=1 Tax=Caenorhabditis brenneri TaxID=135651 RepID=G0NS76_CAEBE|nr:hypothetical protein CAEBREN_22136 [Caenorhabditis brenneri]